MPHSRGGVKKARKNSESPSSLFVRCPAVAAPPVAPSLVVRAHTISISTVWPMLPPWTASTQMRPYPWKPRMWRRRMLVMSSRPTRFPPTPPPKTSTIRLVRLFLLLFFHLRPLPPASILPCSSWCDCACTFISLSLSVDEYVCCLNLLSDSCVNA